MSDDRNRKVEIKVISHEHERIRQEILQEIDRGVTILNGQTGYMREGTELVLSVVSSREVGRQKTCSQH